ncbi:MAG: hypothetical protein ACLTE2_04660 [Eubacteriales bacterium]
MNKIFDWVFIVLTFALALASFRCGREFELGSINFAGFFIGQAVCIAGIAALAILNHFLSKKKKFRKSCSSNGTKKKINRFQYTK